MIKIVSLLFALTFLINLSSMGQLISGGSYSITAICKDGIVLGVDSRAAFSVNTNDKEIDRNPLAYYDFVDKIFCFDNFILSLITVNATNVLFKFYDFIKEKYNPVLNKILKIKFQVAGIVNDRPYVSSNDPDKIIVNGSIDADFNIGGFICCDTLSDFDKHYSEKYSCKEMAEIIEMVIKNYAVKQNQTSNIGGYIRVIQITKSNKQVWIKNGDKAKDYQTMKEFYDDYKNGKVKMTFLNEAAKTIWEKSMILIIN